MNTDIYTIHFHPCSSVFIRVHPRSSVCISGCNLWFHWCPSVYIRVHQWLQSVVPMVYICVYPCSSVVAICGSIGVHPCLSVFISGCNLWFQLSTHHSFDLYPWGTKVDQQSQIQFGRLQVIQQLRLMYFIEG